MSGPSKDSTASFVGDDGRWVHTFRQSGIDSYLHKCADQERLKMEGLMPEHSSSPAAIGTAVHAGIETTLGAVIKGAPIDHDAALLEAMKVYNDIAADPPFVDDHGPRKAGDLIHAAYRKWRHQVLGPDDNLWLKPVASEFTFKHFQFYEDDKRIIRLNGTMDYVDAELGLVDWKTSARPKVRWEEQRWNVQRLYTYPAKHYGLIPDQPVSTMHLCVMVHGVEEVQWVPIVTDEGNKQWLIQQLLEYAETIEVGKARWHLNDGGWWCGPKFCPVYAECRGKYGDHTKAPS